MCIAGSLGIPGSTPQRTRMRSCFVSSINGLSVTANLVPRVSHLPRWGDERPWEQGCVTAWALLCAEWEKSLSDLLAYSPV